MPSSIKNYAIDYNSDGKIDLYTLEDSFASAANYLKKIGWDKNPWGVRVKLSEQLNQIILLMMQEELAKQKKLKNG